MSDIAIRVQNLGKLYRIGQRERYYTLRDTLVNAWRAPFRYLRANGGQRPSGSDSQFTVRNSQSENYIWALKNVSFEVKRGEVVGIIGRNGAGKTTLLKILSRITKPTEGYAEIHGSAGSLLEVGTGFHPELSGWENIYLNGAIMGMKKAEITSKFDEIVAFAEVEKFIDTPVKHYSSGMYMRLAFAVAAHLEPEILIVDEVLAVGDAAFQIKCLGKMREVAHEGRTVLLVSHNMGSIKQLCRESILLHEGRVQKIGLTDDVVDLYLSRELTTVPAEYRWSDLDAPGDHIARLRSIRLCSASGDTRSEFGTHEHIYVEVRYTLFERVSLFRLGFSLHSADETYIFYTSDDDMPAYAGQPRQPGEYISRCEIPAKWLNVGSYQLRLSGGIFYLRTLFHDLPRLTFSITSTGGPTSRYNEKREGILCPTLRWEIHNLGLTCSPLRTINNAND